MTPVHVENAEAFEIVTGADPRILLLCEHASLRLPPPWNWPQEDAWIVGTHWSIDLGARELTLGLAAELDASAVLTRFSRLLIDANRPPDSATLLRNEAEGRRVHLNHGVNDDERAQRLRDCYHPYHRRIDSFLEARPQAVILSLHTFTPVYEGTTRDLEVGVLFNREAELGRRFAQVIGEQGWQCALNEPYSGADGFAFSPELHGERHRRTWLELEIRQDIAVDETRRAQILAAIVAATRATLLPPAPPTRSS